MKNTPVDADDLLKRVSRSFYLTLRILPQAIKPQLGLAYLLARATDTVADTDRIFLAKRQQVLSDFSRSIHAVCTGQTPCIPDFSEFLHLCKTSLSAKNDDELTLLENFEILLGMLGKFSDGDREKIRVVLETITHGQQMDLQLFHKTIPSTVALATDVELDTYTYEVAGCVGEFWTQLCLTHVFPHVKLNRKQLLADAVRFGKGLQLVNILRDLSEDLTRGRCYIPEQALARHGLAPKDLLEQGTMHRFRPLYDEYLKQAEEHLRAGWRYTTSLPFGCVRIRLACAWPILIGMKTLHLLRHHNVLSSERIKITRWEIYLLIVKTILLYPSRTAWHRLLG